MKLNLTKFLIVALTFGSAAWSDAAVRVLPFGDSVTSSYAGHSSYRYWLWHLLMNRGYDVDFVGTQYGVEGGSPDRTDFDQNHEGHSGWQAQNGAQNAYNIFQSTRPDIVLLDLGANDVEQGQDNAQTIEELRQIIQAARAVNPYTIILIAQPSPGMVNNHELRKLNRMIRMLAREENRPESLVRPVNLNSGFNTERDTFDGVHPNETGELKIARRWFRTLNGVLRRYFR